MSLNQLNNIVLRRVRNLVSDFERDDATRHRFSFMSLLEHSSNIYLALFLFLCELGSSQTNQTLIADLSQKKGLFSRNGSNVSSLLDKPISGHCGACIVEICSTDIRDGGASSSEALNSPAELVEQKERLERS